jgi:hypothetical protein
MTNNSKRTIAEKLIAQGWPILSARRMMAQMKEMEAESSDVSDSSQAVSDTPQTDRYVERWNGCDMVHAKVSRELEKKLSAAQAEIAAIKLLLNRAVGVAEGMSWRFSKWDKETEKLKDLKSEIELLGISMEDWYGGFAKIEKICQEPKKE